MKQTATQHELMVRVLEAARPQGAKDMMRVAFDFEQGPARIMPARRSSPRECSSSMLWGGYALAALLGRFCRRWPIP